METVPVPLPRVPTAWMRSVPTYIAKGCGYERESLFGPAKCPVIQVELQIWPPIRRTAVLAAHAPHTFVTMYKMPFLPEEGSLAFEMGMLYWDRMPSWRCTIGRSGTNAWGNTRLWKAGCTNYTSFGDAIRAAGYDPKFDLDCLQERVIVHEGETLDRAPQWWLDAQKAREDRDE